MRSTRAPWTKLAVPVLLMVLLAALAAPASAAPPPADRSYEATFVIPPIGDNPGETVTGCIEFTQDEACIVDLGECAPWIFTPVEGDRRPAFKSIFRYADDDGASVELHVRGMTERRGDPDSSIGGVIAAVVVEGPVRVVINFGFSGREVAACAVPEGSSE